MVLKTVKKSKFLLTESQEVPYYCQPHPWMTETISVELSRF